MVITVTEISLDKVFTKEGNKSRMLWRKKGLFCICDDAVAIKSNLQLLICFR